MNLSTLIGLTLKISIALTVLALGLRTSREEALSLFYRPGLLARSLVSMNVIMPLIALTLAFTFDLHPAVKLALVALSISPVPPFLPGKELKAGGESAYTFGLLVATCALAVIIVPLSIEILGRVTGWHFGVPQGPVAAVVLTTVLAPLSLGIFVRRVAPASAARMSKTIGLVAMILLIISVLSVLFTARQAIMSLIGNGTLLAIAAFVLLGLAAGHLLGGPDPDDRTVLALSTASRHPGVAIAIAHFGFPDLKLAPAAILLYLLVNALVSKPYFSWRRGHHAGNVDIPPVKARHA